jgi:transmembrane sensor
MHDSIQVEEIAAGWLARRDGEGWSADDQVALTAWLQVATAHRVAYIRLDAAWQRACRLKALAGVPRSEIPPSGKSQYPSFPTQHQLCAVSDTPVSVSAAADPPEK